MNNKKRTVQSTLHLFSTRLKKNNYCEQTVWEILDIVRPIIIDLDKQQEIEYWRGFNNGLNDNHDLNK